MESEAWDRIVKKATSTDFMGEMLKTDIGEDNEPKGEEMTNAIAEMRATAEKRMKREDELSTDNRAEIQLVEELEEDWREKEYIKIAFPNNNHDLVQGHLRMYERVLGKKEREELQEAIYSLYCKN